MTKELNIFEKIEGIDEYLSENQKHETVIEIKKSDNPNEKILDLKSGDWGDKEPWFIIDENQKMHTMVSIDTMHKLIENFRQLQKDNFDLKLEKTILQYVPIDYQDVWTVAMDEIKNIASSSSKKSLNIDLEKLLRKIRKDHPNLFLNLQDLFTNQIIQ